MDLKELELGVDPQKHWYYQSKMVPLENYFLEAEKAGINELVDIGAGSGFFTVSLKEKFPTKVKKVHLVDIGYSKAEMEASLNTSIEKKHVIDSDTKDSLLVMMDVLEHIEDDSAFLKSLKDRCTTNNKFFVTVPAFKSIWSGHDVYLEHYRRYTIDSLQYVLQTNGFIPERMYYLYGSLFPAVWLKRKLFDQNQKEAKSDMKPLPGAINSLLKAYASAEMKLARWNKTFGLSCVAEGRIL